MARDWQCLWIYLCFTFEQDHVLYFKWVSMSLKYLSAVIKLISNPGPISLKYRLHHDCTVLYHTIWISKVSIICERVSKHLVGNMLCSIWWFILNTGTSCPVQKQHVMSVTVFNSSSLDKMAAISQTTFSNAFSWKKKFDFWLKFHWTLFLGVRLIIYQHWFR